MKTKLTNLLFSLALFATINAFASISIAQQVRSGQGAWFEIKGKPVRIARGEDSVQLSNESASEPWCSFIVKNVDFDNAQILEVGRKIYITEISTDEFDSNITYWFGTDKVLMNLYCNGRTFTPKIVKSPDLLGPNVIYRSP